MSIAQYTMAPPSKKRKKRDWSSIVFQVLFLLPAAAFLIIFMFYPIEETFRLSLMRYTGLGKPTYIGLQNYSRLLADDKFITAFFNVLGWAFWSVVIQIPLAFFIAYSLTAFRNRITGPLRAIYYLASVMPSAITAMLGRLVFAPRYGVLASLAETLNWQWLANIDFLGNANLAFWSVFAVATWAYTGFNIVYLMANIEQIPAEIREASMLDGANRWQYARYVVLPMVSYPLLIITVTTIVGSLKVFDLPYLLTNGGPGYATTTLVIYLYQEGFVNWLYGRAAAIGVVIFLLSLFFAVTLFTMQKRKGDFA
ncbi:MAG: sugar ABC transporter permease [Firmicutes bacterium]|nr:sugar ABC transporter permease [Bacillota bacterium]